MRTSLGWAALLLLPVSASASTLSVGPGKTYAKPCDAFAAANPGDTVEIDSSGNYAGDSCVFNVKNLTIRGVGTGRVKLDATGVTIPNGKAIWVISGNNDVVENIEFMGAQVPDSNGAGIRGQAPNLTLRNCYFHDNQDGILTSPDPDGGDIEIDGCEFFHNGAGDGQSHNMYIGATGKFVLMNSYSHAPIGGHEVKTRARENYILYNRIEDEATGEGSYQINLAQSGTSYIIGNLIEKGPDSQNDSQFIRDECQGGCSPGNDLYVVNNTFVNDVGHAPTFVYLASTVPAATALIRNNIFAGPGTVTNLSGATADHNLSGADPKFVDQTSYDYHLLAGSPAIDQGAAPGSSPEGFDLTPTSQYVDQLASEPRSVVGSAIDIGAYEFGNPATSSSSTGSASSSSSSSGSTGGGVNTSGSTGGASNSSGSTGGGANSSGSTGGTSSSGGNAAGSGAAGGTSGSTGAASTSGCGCIASGSGGELALGLLLAAFGFASRSRKAG